MKNIDLLKNLKVNLHLTKECNYNVLDNYNDNYVIIGNLLKESFDDIMERYNFDLKLYNDRY